MYKHKAEYSNIHSVIQVPRYTYRYVEEASVYCRVCFSISGQNGERDMSLRKCRRR
jgi:hypothetical protein